MGGIFNLLAIPFGYVLWFIYSLISNYFIAIFLFTLIMRAATFPLSLKSQKSQAERAKLAPRLERIQKKYGQDRQKLQQKQMELYEKEGVSMTGGCLPMIVQMILLMGVISVIYSPLTHLARMPESVVNASVAAITQKDGENKPNKVSPKDLTGYYKELRLLMVAEDNEADIKAALNENKAILGNKTADQYYQEMMDLRQNFTFGSHSLLENPGTGGFKGINILWLIPLISGLTSLGVSLISMRYTKALTQTGEKVPGQGCSNVMMMVMMPLFSVYIAFIVPGAVGIYWICSNVISGVQTILLNHIYNPAKIRAQAEIEYEERRRRKAEDKKRLKEARLREEEEARQQAKLEAEEKEKVRLEEAAARKKPVEASKNPNKMKRREAAKESDKAVAHPDQPPTEKSAKTEQDPSKTQADDTKLDE